MARFTLFLVGALSALAAWTLVGEQRKTARKVIPATQAAALLQQAWADHHTRA